MTTKIWFMIFSAILSLLCITMFTPLSITIDLNMIIGIISVPVAIFAFMYSLEYKKANGKKPKGVGLIDFGASFNLACGLLFGSFAGVGSFLVLIGFLIFLFSEKYFSF